MGRALGVPCALSFGSRLPGSDQDPAFPVGCQPESGMRLGGRRVAPPSPQECVVSYFEQREIEAFFRRDVSELDSYLRVVNVAHDLPPVQALGAVVELLEYADSEADIALVAACALQPVVELHHGALAPELEAALRASPKLRAALRGVITTGLPADARARLDGIE